MKHSSNTPNQLIREKSPYLLQHAFNPVAWYPWGQEAFDRAEKENKPVFLSIGYSTCHWCHVMERESFEDEEAARLLNQSFISIKVDREERPDVDSVYMEVCQALTGSGGWPLTILMTPDQRPFYAATYLPKKSRYGRPGLLELLTQVSEIWKNSPKRLYQTADEILRAMKEEPEEGMAASMDPPGNNAASEAVFQQWGQNPFRQPGQGAGRLGRTAERTARQLAASFDRSFGGFGHAPKFPVPHNLLFLLKQYEHTGEESLLWMAEETLVWMYRGGIFDHIGGGFSRYSTDERWLAPHFEKMLYDNALLSLAYLEAYRITQKGLYLSVAQRTLDYITRELTHDKGGLFCGQDADSDGEEGKYYVFTPAEIKIVLGEEDGEQFCRFFDITEQGNFEGKSIPNLLQNDDYENLPGQIHQWRELLYEYRMNRTSLSKDDKILTSWNGLGILAFVKAYQVTGQTSYLKQARKAASFVRANLMTLRGRLKVRWRDLDVAGEGMLSDYAFYGLALLELYEADFNVSWLRTGVKLGETMLELFEDEKKGGFFLYGSNVPQLITRPKEIYDGAIPSGNGAAALFLRRLAGLTGQECFQEAFYRQLDFLHSCIEEAPAQHTFGMLAVQEEIWPGKHVVCASSGEIPSQELRCFQMDQGFTADVLVVTEQNKKALGKLAPQVPSCTIPEEGQQYYVCRDGACLPPVSRLSELEAQNGS